MWRRPGTQGPPQRMHQHTTRDPHTVQSALSHISKRSKQRLVHEIRGGCNRAAPHKALTGAAYQCITPLVDCLFDRFWTFMAHFAVGVERRRKTQ